MTSRQLNIRLSASDRDRLEALAFVRRRQPAVVAREILLEYLERHQGEAGLEEALAALMAAQGRAGKNAKVHTLGRRVRRP